MVDASNSRLKMNNTIKSNSRPAASARVKDQIIVFISNRDNTCAECRESLTVGELVWLNENKVYCVDCADLGHLEFLPSGDLAITRRATKYSRRVAIVLKHSRARKRNERQGILAEPAAIRRAEEESLSDADLRAKRREQQAKQREVKDQQYIESFKAVILQRYPGCPVDEAADIAHHACAKYSGRVGRSAGAKEFDPDKIDLAVLAHIRHAHTEYNQLLKSADILFLSHVHVNLQRRLQRLYQNLSAGPEVYDGHVFGYGVRPALIQPTLPG